MTYGTLARVPLAGGAPRELQENVKYADWSPNGNDLVLVRRRRRIAIGSSCSGALCWRSPTRRRRVQLPALLARAATPWPRSSWTQPDFSSTAVW